MMRRRSEDLLTGPLSKLTLLIRDKQQLRKTYGDQWSHLSLELSRVTQTELERLKTSYRQAVRYNEYVLSVRAAQVYHQHHYSQTQPALLNALQNLQQEMVLVLKEILQEYFDMSTLLNQEVMSIHRELSTALKSIEPQREYESFIQQNRSVGEVPVCVEFDCGLLEDTDLLTAGELELNELTVEGIQHRLTAVEEELLALAGSLGSQQAYVNQLELELEADEEGVKKGQR